MDIKINDDIDAMANLILFLSNDFSQHIINHSK